MRVVVDCLCVVLYCAIYLFILVIKVYVCITNTHTTYFSFIYPSPDTLHHDKIS